MKRFIVLDMNNVVVATRDGYQIVEGEIESETGELGQIMQTDGSFLDPEPTEPPEKQSVEEQLSELQEQNLVLMDALATIFEAITGGQ